MKLVWFYPIFSDDTCLCFYIHVKILLPRPHYVDKLQFWWTPNDYCMPPLHQASLKSPFVVPLQHWSTMWISGSEHYWSWGENKAAGEQRKTLEPLVIPCLHVVSTTETIPLCRRAAKQFVNRVLSLEREREMARVGEWASRLRTMLAKMRGRRHLYAGLNFGTLAFSD